MLGRFVATEILQAHLKLAVVAKRRQNAAHGVCRGSVAIKNHRAPEGAKETPAMGWLVESEVLRWPNFVGA